MKPTDPHVARLAGRLLAQLAPAALVAGIGVLLLGNLARAPSPSAGPAPVETAIHAEAVFRPAPREAAATRLADVESTPSKAPARATVKPRPLAARSDKVVSEPPAQRELAIVSAPLPILPAVADAQASAQDTGGENAIVRALHGTTAAMRRLPEWAAQSWSGWFAEAEPPRPPASVPAQQFQASM